MTDWATISSLATAGGTLILAVATYQSVRSANRSARVAERSLSEGVRPWLIPSREEDPTERVRFGDGIVLDVPGHGGSAEVRDGVVYLAVGLRNAGAGPAVIHGWRARAQLDTTPSPSLMVGDEEAWDRPVASRPPLPEFRRQQLDIYVPNGESGFWQGALRDPAEPGLPEVSEAVRDGRGLWIDLLYGDHQGGQKAIVRLLSAALPGDEGGERRLTVLQYWDLDREESR